MKLNVRLRNFKFLYQGLSRLIIPVKVHVSTSFFNFGLLGSVAEEMLALSWLENDKVCSLLPQRNEFHNRETFPFLKFFNQ